MVRCEEFYEKWKRDPNWCLKSPAAVSRINRYIDLTERCPALRALPEGALRPLLGKKSAPIRQKVIHEVNKRIQEGKKVDAHILKNIIRQQYAILPIGKKEAQIGEIDTGVRFHCELCGEDYVIIHVGLGKHRFQRVRVV